jgi:hypothetical protein
VTRPALHGEIEGYASASAIANGEELTLYVSTPAPSFRADFYRMGWYGGPGARRLLSLRRPGKVQPLPTMDSRRTVRANWAPSLSFVIPADWVSGAYLVKLTSARYQNPGGSTVGPFERYVFVVVDGSASNADLLFQCSTFTYQAYNTWGNHSLYTGPGIDDASRYANRSYAVSFGRPYADGYGSQDFLKYEYPLIRWLERNGFDVAYTASEVVHENPERLRLHCAFLSIGHDEYWSLNIRNGVESARDNGTSVAFFGSNAAYWRVRIDTDPGTGSGLIICYKDATLDPLSNAPGIHPDITVTWRDDPYPRPEDALIGQMWESWFESSNFPLVCTNTSNWVYTGSGAQDSDAIPGIVGYEYDRVFRNDYPEGPGCEAGDAPSHSGPLPSNLEILAASPVTGKSGCQSFSNVTLYRASSGAWVFSAGTNAWSWGLDDLDPGLGVPWLVHNVSSRIIQRITTNLLRRFCGEWHEPQERRNDLSYLVPLLLSEPSRRRHDLSYLVPLLGGWS